MNLFVSFGKHVKLGYQRNKKKYVCLFMMLPPEHSVFICREFSMRGYEVKSECKVMRL